MRILMTPAERKSNYIAGLVTLYYLLIIEDGYVDKGEVKMREIIKEHEKIDESQFDYYIEKAADLNKEQLMNSCISYLNNCEYERKVKCIAWMSRIANSDGFMHPGEWKLIYRFYHNELKLNITDIVEVQQHLPRVA